MAAGIPVHQPEKIAGTNFHEILAAYAADVFVVAAYGKILRQNVLDLPRLGCINVHASLLPRYRGAAPIHWAIINGERKTGVTIMKMDAGMDTGDMLDKAEVDILEDDDVESLSNILSVQGADLLLRTLDRVERDDAIRGEPQDHSQATVAPMLKKEDACIDWSLRSEQVHCLIRGVNPKPGAYSMLNGAPWRIHRAGAIDPHEYAASGAKAAPGQIIGLLKGLGVVVRTGDGALLLTRIQPPSKQAMDAAACINGNLLRIGQRFGKE